MKVTLLCSDPSHPINTHLLGWIERNRDDHEINLIRSKKDLVGGDILFLVSCSEIISSSDRMAYSATLVLHASALPIGRGWSPHVWQIINGAENIILTLLDAEDAVDGGRIWHQVTLRIPKHALWDEINEQLFRAEIELIDYAIRVSHKIVPVEQSQTIEPTYYPRRKPEDSEIDPELSIAAQFDLIRVSDPNRYPSYFYLRGNKYRLILEKIDG
jgi:methionyl-tRNA formyltransferase